MEDNTKIDQQIIEQSPETTGEVKVTEPAAESAPVVKDAVVPKEATSGSRGRSQGGNRSGNFRRVGGFQGRGGSGGSGGPGGSGGQGGHGGGGRGRRAPEFEVKSEYEEKNVEIARVTRVTKGGKRMRFRALAVIGNRKGRVGYGVGKGVDFPGSTAKAAAQARKSLITVPIVRESIPHAVKAKFGAAQVILKPAPKGTGIKAGGPVRAVLELAGIGNITAKILGSQGKINNVKATFKALGMLRIPQGTGIDNKKSEDQVSKLDEMNAEAKKQIS